MGSALPRQIVYLAGPMSGLPFEECRKWRDKATRSLQRLRDARTKEPLYHVLNPLRGHDELVGQECTANYDDASAEKEDIRRDRYDVSRSDIVLADLTDAMIIGKSSIGTICELDQAHMEGKFIILVMTPENPHWHSFLKDLAGVIKPDLDSALAYMRNVLNVSVVED
jgi:hypothetical protein